MSNLAKLQNKAAETLRKFIDREQGISTETAKIALNSLLFAGKIKTCEQTEDSTIPAYGNDIDTDSPEYLNFLMREAELEPWRAISDGAAWIEKELDKSFPDREIPSNLEAVRILLCIVLLYFPQPADANDNVEGYAVYHVANSIDKALTPYWEEELDHVKFPESPPEVQG